MPNYASDYLTTNTRHAKGGKNVYVHQKVSTNYVPKYGTRSSHTCIAPGKSNTFLVLENTGQKSLQMYLSCSSQWVSS